MLGERSVNTDFRVTFHILNMIFWKTLPVKHASKEQSGTEHAGRYAKLNQILLERIV